MSSPAVTAVEPLWMKYARELVGLKEIVGSGHEAKVLKFFAEAGHPEVKNDETAWCAAFANAMLRRAGWAGTGSLAARSFLIWGTKLSEPKPGCIVVFKRGNTSWQGHVGFVVSATDKTLKVLGGNQGNAVSIQTFKRDDSVLGYRWPLIKAAQPAVIVKQAPPVVVQKPPSKGAVAGAAAGGAVVAGGAAAASQQGVSALEICLWIGGPSLVAIAALIIGYRIIKGYWPWTSTGKALPELLPLSPPSSELSSEQVSAALLAVSSEASPATPLQASSVSSRPRKRSAKPSPRTRTPSRKSSSSKRSAAKKSAPKRKSKSKG